MKKVLQVFLLLSFMTPPMLVVSCREREEGNSASSSTSEPIKSASEEPNLNPEPKPIREDFEAEKLRLQAEDDNIQAEVKRIRADLGVLESIVDEHHKNLTALQSEKERLQAEARKLEKKWSLELVGFERGGPDRPLIEIYREMVDKLDALIQENRELKEQLKAQAE